MSPAAPHPLAAHHRLDGFDCGKPALTEWLLCHAHQAQGSGSARIFVSCEGERVAGYYNLTVGQIDTLEAPERVRCGMGQDPIPLIILARLAVDLDDEKRGLGFSLLRDAIHRAIAVAEHAGIRALLTHPLDADADALYRRLGFETAPHDEQRLLILLKDARRIAGAAHWSHASR